MERKWNVANPNPSPENRFQLGWEGGPGRPKGSVSLTTLIKARLAGTELCGKHTPDGRAVAEWLVDQMIHQAMKGNSAYMKEIMDRNDGPIPKPEPAPTGDIDELLDEADRIAAERERSETGRSPGAVEE